MKSILVVAAHPDDEVLGCGATLAKLSKSHEVHILILGEGFTSRKETGDPGNTKGVEQLANSARAAAVVIGAHSINLEGFPDNRFDEVPLLDVVKRVEAVILETSPETIYTHHPGDLNNDHRIAFQAVLTASRPVANSSVKHLFTFEIPSSTEWAFQQFQPVFKPNVFVDVSETIDVKIKAMAQYESEMRPFPHPRSTESLRIIAKRWGLVVGLEYVEVFEVVRSIR